MIGRVSGVQPVSGAKQPRIDNDPLADASRINAISYCFDAAYGVGALDAGKDQRLTAPGGLGCIADREPGGAQSLGDAVLHLFRIPGRPGVDVGVVQPAGADLDEDLDRTCDRLWSVFAPHQLVEITMAREDHGVHTVIFAHRTFTTPLSIDGSHSRVPSDPLRRTE